MKISILVSLFLLMFAFTAFAADDPYHDRVLDINASARKAVAVTPSDTVDLVTVPRGGLYVGTGGNITVIMADDTAAVLFANAYGFIPLMVKRVLATGTDATNIVALY